MGDDLLPAYVADNVTPVGTFVAARHGAEKGTDVVQAYISGRGRGVAGKQQLAGVRMADLVDNGAGLAAPVRDRRKVLTDADAPNGVAGNAGNVRDLAIVQTLGVEPAYLTDMNDIIHLTHPASSSASSPAW